MKQGQPCSGCDLFGLVIPSEASVELSEIMRSRGTLCYTASTVSSHLHRKVSRLRGECRAATLEMTAS
jgi:hypothetical protein